MALRDIKEGELIFENEPIVVGPNQNAKSVCLGCFAEVGNGLNNEPIYCFISLLISKISILY